MVTSEVWLADGVADASPRVRVRRLRDLVARVGAAECVVVGDGPGSEYDIDRVRDAEFTVEAVPRVPDEDVEALCSEVAEPTVLERVVLVCPECVKDALVCVTIRLADGCESVLDPLRSCE